MLITLKLILCAKYTTDQAVYEFKGMCTDPHFFMEQRAKSFDTLTDALRAYNDAVTVDQQENCFSDARLLTLQDLHNWFYLGEDL